MHKVQNAPKYNNSSRLQAGKATAPEFLVKVRLTKAVNFDRGFEYQDIRMTVTLYDV